MIDPAGEFTALSLPMERHELPSDLRGEAPLVIATVPNVATLVGGEGGLYEFRGEDGFRALDQRSVVSVARLGERLIIAYPERFELFDGQLKPSSLHGGLDGSPITALASQADETLWIGTEKKLWRYAGGKLEAFDGLAGVRSLSTYGSANDVVVQLLDGTFVGLRETDAGFKTQSLSEEQQALDQVVPRAGGEFVGAVGGTILHRKPTPEGKATWSAVGLGQLSAAALAVEPESGLGWVVSKKALFRLDELKVARQEPARELTKVVSATATADGMLWIYDGTALHRVGDDGKPVAYEADVAPFLSANCERCHGDSGPGRDLRGFELARANLDKMIEEMQAGRMPADGRPLSAGDVNLLIRWRNGGLQR